jgi:pullulanase-type alpha-1,6-glucosidase
VNATFDDASGVWSAQADVAQGAEYLWEVEVYAHSTRTVETNAVTDPYSHALTMDSRRSVAIDLSSDQWMPGQWVETPQPKIEKAVDRAIYELHIRDFSIGDESVPVAERGTYRAFTRDGAGARQLRELAEAGITTVHLLPSFDIATISEDRAAHATPNCDLTSFAPDSDQQQACVGAIRGADGFNWGYDPFHYTTPEGSYAVDPNGGARVAEYREMVGALHNMGLEVVLDQVFNHTAQSGQGDKSVLDRIVPGYYHRLSDTGRVETSTCCENIATEFAAAEKLMVDSVVTWARDYKIDGFRFDLMGHHSRDNMLAVRSALDELTLAKDGVDGSAVYLYGEGWDFGEVSGDTRFVQARQGNLGGTGIGTFNDRLRDGVHGGSPVASNTILQQGYGTGLGTDPNGAPINGSTQDALAALGPATDLVKVGLAGNLRDFTFLASDGELRRGSEIDYNGSPAGYAEQPDEIVNYVDAHDNETLYDLAVLKLPQETSMPDRVRMNTLMLGTATLSQGVSFWHAGTELLRSKSLDRNSYDSGDWFNRIDWTGQESTFGSGLPMAADNQDKWSIMAPLLADPALKPTAADIAQAEGAALDLLRVRSEVELLRLGDADLIKQKVSFPNGGPDATPGVIVMLIDDLIGADVDPGLAGALVVFNASPEATTEALPDLAGRNFALTPALANGSDSVVRQTAWNAQAGSVTVPARTVAVLVEPQQQSGGNTDPDEEDNTTPDSGTRPDVDDSDEPSDTTQQTGNEETDSVEVPDEASDRLSDTGVNPATWGAAVFSALLIAFGGAFLALRRRHTVE